MIKRILFSILIFLFVLTSCSNLPGSVKINSDPVQDANPSMETGTDEIEFNVYLTQPLQAGDELMLAKLDVVTGGMIAPKFFQLVKVDELHYLGRLPSTETDTLRYKYIKVGSVQVNEAFPWGRGDYRVLLTTNSSSVNDFIYGWENSVVEPQKAILAGRVLTSQGDAPINGALIQIQGITAKTDIFGRYEIPGLPEGTYFATFSSGDDSFETYQQLAVLEADKVTVADVWLKEVERKTITFNVDISPAQLPANDVYLIGDIYQLGFRTNSHGVSAFDPKALIKMDKVSETRYKADVEVPLGTTFEYKYSLGDGFWGAERNKAGEIFTRSFSANSNSEPILDKIEQWGFDSKRIEVVVPANTPDNLPVTILLNAFVSSIPIPLLLDSSGVYYLEMNSPSELIKTADVQICLGFDPDFACGIFQNGKETETINFTDSAVSQLLVSNWNKEIGSDLKGDLNLSSPIVEDFEAGVAINLAELSNSEVKLNEFGLNLPEGSSMIMESDVRFDWTGDHYQVLTGDDSIGSSLNQNLIAEAKALELDPWLSLKIDEIEGLEKAGNQVLDPQPIDSALFALDQQLMILAQTANLSEVDTIVIGGDGLADLIPGADSLNFVDETSQTAISNSINQMLKDLREHFNGKIYYALKYNNSGLHQLPSGDLGFDGYLIDWTTGLTDSEQVSKEEMTANVNLMLEYDIIPSIPFGKRIIIRANVPTSTGALLGCSNNSPVNCVAEDGGNQTLDITAQQNIYQSFMTAISARTDIEGFISGGFNPTNPFIKSDANIFMRPAYQDLKSWLEVIYAR